MKRRLSSVSDTDNDNASSSSSSLTPAATTKRQTRSVTRKQKQDEVMRSNELVCMIKFNDDFNSQSSSNGSTVIRDAIADGKVLNDYNPRLNIARWPAHVRRLWMDYERNGPNVVHNAPTAEATTDLMLATNTASNITLQDEFATWDTTVAVDDYGEYRVGRLSYSQCVEIWKDIMHNLPNVLLTIVTQYLTPLAPWTDAEYLVMFDRISRLHWSLIQFGELRFSVMTMPRHVADRILATRYIASYERLQLVGTLLEQGTITVENFKILRCEPCRNCIQYVAEGADVHGGYVTSYGSYRKSPWKCACCHVEYQNISSQCCEHWRTMSAHTIRWCCSICNNSDRR